MAKKSNKKFYSSDMYDSFHYSVSELNYFNEIFAVRQKNKQRFLNYCHKGTVIQHLNSKVKWEVLAVVENTFEVITSSYGQTTMGLDTKKYIKVRSLNGGNKLKKYKKTISLEDFHNYDILEVPDAVKVLWGDPKTNPPEHLKR